MKIYLKPKLVIDTSIIDDILVISMNDGIFDFDDENGGYDEVWE